ncbi:MAG: hypothetical protein GY861_09660 [bacterium]|nr:hypothetical protein [bacterium]
MSCTKCYYGDMSDGHPKCRDCVWLPSNQLRMKRMKDNFVELSELEKPKDCKCGTCLYYSPHSPDYVFIPNELGVCRFSRLTPEHRKSDSICYHWESA